MNLRRNHHQTSRFICGIITLLFVIFFFGVVHGDSALAFPVDVKSNFQGERTTREVTNVNDSGPGSFRDALTNAEAGDQIVFDAGIFPPETPGVINVVSDVLPPIEVDNLTIDAVGRGVILDGGGLIENGLVLEGSNITIQGVQIRHFTGYGVYLDGATYSTVGGDRLAGEGNVISGNDSHGIFIDGIATHDNLIAGNIIGADMSGTSALPNGGCGVRIQLGSKNNIVGGELISGRDYGNLISGNVFDGVFINGSGSNGNVVQGNQIGTDITGNAPLGNGGDGIEISGGADDSCVIDNIIAGNGDAGIEIAGNSTNGSIIMGNSIGVSQSGTQALPNYRGILIGAGAKYTQIGGDTPAARNVVSGNENNGIQIESTSDTIIQGNYIGTDPSGSFAIPNQGNGIEIDFLGSNTVGGPLIGENCTDVCNLVSGNLGVGIAIYQSGGNIIQGNFVGSDWTGEEDLGNSQVGIRLNLLGTDNNKIGGAGAGEGNLIRYNQGGGVTLTVSTSANELSGNRIENNYGVAIRYHPGNILGVNHCSGNDPNQVEVQPGPLYGGNSVLEGETWLVQGDLNRFVVLNHPGLGDDMIVQSGSTWQVGPGVEVLFDFNEGALVQGHLEVQGTSDKPVIFGSAQRYTAPLRGDWLGLSFETSSSGNLSHTTVEFAETGLSLIGANVSLSNSIIAASELDGIYVGAGSTLDLDDNTIAGNGHFGIYNPTGITIDAQGTWWGHASGPDYYGDAAVGDYIDYSNWLEDPGYNDSWKFASALNPGTHIFAIDSYQDLDWFRVPIGTRNATVTVSMSQLPRDYDLFVFSQLGSSSRDADELARTMTIGQISLVGDLDTASQTMTLARTMTIGQLADIGDGFETGNMVAASSQPGTVDEEVSIDVWNRSGWHYILVAGHNGANSPQVYQLNITITPGLPVIEPGFEPPNFEPPDSYKPGVKTLILTNQGQLQARYDITEVDALMTELAVLAEHPEVAGEVIDLNSIEPIKDAEAIRKVYTLWSENPENPVYANLVAGAIRGWLDVNRAAYPDLMYLVLVGGDGILPFWRVPDEVPMAHEGTYNPYLLAGSPTGSAMFERYYFTDDYYGGFAPIPYRGRGLVFPEYGIGRLVENPQEIIAYIDSFIASPSLSAANSLVTGYEFMEDGAQALVGQWQSGGLSVYPMIDGTWTASDLETAWLSGTYDINAINAHFEHWQAIPAQPASGTLTSTEAAGSGNLTGTLNYSIGCHSGLSVPDDEATQNGLDFAQALLGGGASWVGNTGYGYGDADAVGYSEMLMNLFTQKLVEGKPLGHALRGAKEDYFNLTGVYSFSPYDEKVLAQATLYGLPMISVEMPIGTETDEKTGSFGFILESGRSDGLVTRQISFDFEQEYETHESSFGTYFSLGGETEVNEWQPIQPRTSIDISLEGETPHGAFFEGGTYTTIADFNPVISRIDYDPTTVEEEPNFDNPGIWQPSWWSLVNQVWTAEGLKERLVVIPAQYKGTTNTMGTERLFDMMDYALYYSDINDYVPPSIWRVDGYRFEEKSYFTVEVTDLSDVERVGVTYTTGGGSWVTVDLLQSQSNPNLWMGTIQDYETIEWFVQAVDKAGNVAVNDNKGAYFGRPAERFWIWLPMILK